MLMFTKIFVLYMWINLYILIFIFTIIFTGKFVQYFRRWGYSMEIHLECTPKTTELLCENSSLPIPYLQIHSTVKKPSKKVLLLTPFTVSQKRFLHLATALALNYNDVILIQSKNILMQIKAKKIEIQTFASILVSTFSPDAIIACDVFYPIFLSEIKQRPLIGFVFLRPILFLNQFNLLYYIPLSIPWFYTLFLRIHLLPSLSSSISLQFDNQKFPRKMPNVLCISPKRLSRGFFGNTHLRNQFDVDFLKTKFSFRDYEAVVYGKIQNFISKVSFSQ